MTFGELLKTTRESRKDTLAQLAQQTSGSVSFLCDIEHGRRLPSQPYARRLAEVLRADPFEWELAVALETGRIEFDPEGVPRDAIARALNEVRSGRGPR